MSFEETPEAFIWRCDDCQLVAEFVPHDFYRSLAELKARGWRMCMVGEREGWMNYCGKCWRKRARANVTEFLNRKSGSGGVRS
jgi:hypothetical protein